ncbi:glycosyltransferase family 2 protein, partial [Thomasclavelia sp.]
MNELVSIVVPMYNVEKKLERCLDSLECQTYENIEVILINDGSPDNLEKICLRYIRKDNRFNYYRKKNGGLSSARNFGISKAKGKYIYFIDSDDF